MSMTKITDKHIEDLAKAATEALDLDALVDFVESSMEAHYRSLTAKEFVQEWESVFDEEFPTK